MREELLASLSDWSALDTWIVVTAALAAMACALPGNFLLLRRQSMMGDALSHTVLLGVVAAFLLAHWVRAAGWISPDTYYAVRYGTMFAGAVVIGMVFALATEAVRKLGKVESSAALGVVFTTMFALGLLLIRVAADDVHLDPDCVLYGMIETVVMDTVGESAVPRAAVVNLAALSVNLLLLLLCYKELKITTFDPQLATALGIHATGMHYALMAVTAATLVSAFETVGSILVIAMLIVPPATASLLTMRLGRMIGLSLVLAALGAVLGHAAAISLPSLLFSRLGFPSVVDASTAGMTAAASGLLFFLAVLFAPRHGLLSKAVGQLRLGLKIVREDLLGLLYRLEESGASAPAPAVSRALAATLGMRPWLLAVALRRLRRDGQIAATGSGYRLTDAGREAAQHLVRSHRLWESYMARHFNVPDDHLHPAAARVEHYIDHEVSSQLAAELDLPRTDPHGRQIPPEGQG